MVVVVAVAVPIVAVAISLILRRRVLLPPPLPPPPPLLLLLPLSCLKTPVPRTDESETTDGKRGRFHGDALPTSNQGFWLGL